MTISSETRLIRYTGNGATTAFPYTFFIPDADSVEVSVITIADGTVEIIDSADYTITGVGETTFGSVTYPLVGSPLSSSYYFIIKRVVAYAQNLDVTGQDTYDPELLEEQLDLIVMQTQQLAEEQSRNLVGQAGESFDSTLPPKATLANQVLGFDADGEPKAVTVASMGTVAVPASSTDNQLMKWDGITADNIQNALATEDDSGNLTPAGAVNGAAAVTVASAATCDVLGAASNFVTVSGTTTITSLGTGVNRMRVVTFSGALTLTHNATSLILPGGANITTAAGDTIIIVSDASSNVRVVGYLDASDIISFAIFLATANTWAATQNFADNILQRALLKDYGEVTNAIGSIGGGTQDIDLTLGNVVTATVDTSTTTFTFSNPTASDEECSFKLYLTNGGSQTVNWPASVDWEGGTAPTLTASGVDILIFTTVTGGTTWFGFVAGLDMQ